MMWMCSLCHVTENHYSDIKQAYPASDYLENTALPRFEHIYIWILWSLKLALNWVDWIWKIRHLIKKVTGEE